MLCYVNWYLSSCDENVLKLRGTMLFQKSSMRIGMKVSNRCSIIALVFLYPPVTHEETVILEENVV